MPKKFYTDKDIEELHRKGIKTLQMSDDVVLTDLAYEKAKRLEIQLAFDHAEVPPAAPVRPYLSVKEPPRTQPTAVSVPQPGSQPKPAITPTPSQTEKGNAANLEKRIRSAVIARLGNQVDPKLLDNIIRRVVKATGLK